MPQEGGNDDRCLDQVIPNQVIIGIDVGVMGPEGKGHETKRVLNVNDAVTFASHDLNDIQDPREVEIGNRTLREIGAVRAQFLEGPVTPPRLSFVNRIFRRKKP